MDKFSKENYAKASKSPEKVEKLFKKFAEEYEKCLIYPVYFIENYIKIIDQKTGELIPFILWLQQKKQLKIWNENQYSITLKARQLGISLLSGVWDLHQCFFLKNFQSMVISKKEDDAKDYLRDVEIMFNNMPELFREVNPIISKNQTKLEFKNGSRLMVESSNPNAGRSRHLNRFTMDEAAFMQDAVRIWTAAKPTIEKGNGKGCIISTANGYDKFFEPKWRAGNDGKISLYPNFISWHGDPNRTEEWYLKELAEAINEGPEAEGLFRQEYPSDPNEAFMMTGNSVFNQKNIQAHIDRIKKNNPKKIYGYFNEFGNFIQTEPGELIIFDFPRYSQEYVIGADVAEGLEKGDNSVAVVYGRDFIRGQYHQAAEYCGKIDTDSFGKFLVRLGRFFNNATLCPEMNSYGESVMNVIQKQCHYPKIFHQIRYDEATAQPVKKLGWKTTRTTKPIMIDCLKTMLREQTLNILSLEALNEMRTFVHIDSGNASRMEADGNNKDDRVIAHSLCSVMLLENKKIESKRHLTQPQYKHRLKHNLKWSPSFNLQKMFEK